MSTTLTTLEINATNMRELFADVFTNDYSVAALKALKKAIAKATLTDDLYNDFKIQPDTADDLTRLDTIIDKYSTTFQNALMYLQCHFYFVENDDTDGKNAKRAQYCLNQYNKIRATFGDMSTDTMVTSIIATIARG